MTKAATPKHFEAALAELELLVQRMEQGDLTLDAMLDSYRRGHELLAFCRTKLEVVEQQAKLFEAAIESTATNGARVAGVDRGDA